MMTSRALIYIFIAATIWFGILYAKARRTGDAGWVDVGWSSGIGFAAVFLLFVVEGNMLRKILVAVLVVIWAGRLACYIIRDRLTKGVEDGRYQALRSYWGDRADRNFFWFFELQSFLVVLFTIPFLIAMQKTSPLFDLWDGLGIAIGIVSIWGESIADGQLARFRANPDHAGQVCQSGFWRYSRHPNYFFEWLYWWSFVFLSIGSAGWAWSLAGPVFMLLFIFKLTGIPHTERQALTTRGPAYAQYRKTTNMFFPWQPKKDLK